MFQKIYEVLFDRGRGILMLKGYVNTVLIAVFALVIGIGIGVVIALLKVLPRNRWYGKLLNRLADVYIAVIRGTPILVQLAILYFIILQNLIVPSLLVAIIGFGINSGAYVAEIIRSGIMSVDRGQMEAGRSMGLSFWQTMVHIILPQAIKNILPALGNEAIVLIKETSVAGIVTVTEFWRAIENITSSSYNYLIPYLFAAAVYLLTVLLMTFGLSKLEKRLRKSDAR